jgi:hypothetical protein
MLIIGKKTIGMNVTGHIHPYYNVFLMMQSENSGFVFRLEAFDDFLPAFRLMQANQML